MRLQGIITEAKYVNGVSQRTGNPYELTNYTFQHTDAQGHNHLMIFTLSGQKMYDEKVHKGDRVEVSVQLGLREYNGNKYNEVRGVYYVGKIGAQAQPAQTMQQMPQTIQPSAPVFQQGQQTQVAVPVGAQPMMAVNNQNGGAYQQAVAAVPAGAPQPTTAAPAQNGTVLVGTGDDLPF